MTGFRGSDETLEHEIEAIERIARLRLRRATHEMRDLDRDLRELKRERARRRAETSSEVMVSEASSQNAEV
jgi:hypothetical protein